jgi:hypothetical protein
MLKNYEIYGQGLTNKEIEVVLGETLKLGIRERLTALWSCFKDLEGDKVFREIMQTVKINGIKLKFDIRNYLYGDYDEFLDSNNIRIRGCLKCNIQEFWDECEEREKMMKEVIRGLWEEGEQITKHIEGHNDD